MPKKAPWITKDVRIVEAMGWLTGACSVVLTGFAIAAVPTGEKVPVHYGVDMQPNRWGSPVELLLLPIVHAGLHRAFGPRSPSGQSRALEPACRSRERREGCLVSRKCSLGGLV